MENLPINFLVISISILFLILFIKEKQKYKELEKKLNEFNNKYFPITDIEAKVIEQKKILDELSINYINKKPIYDELVKQIRVYENDLELIDLGFYKPIFDFDTSEKYKEEIESIRNKQKEMLINKTAIYCNTEWSVSGSKSKGQTMTNKNMKMTARAFNNECDVLIDKVRWNNVDKMIERIENCFDAINKLNESNDVKISEKYLELKKNELHLVYEYQKKKQEEKEEQAEIRARIKEEEKLEQEILEAKKEEEQYIKLLEKAKKDVEKATGEKLEKLNEKIKQLEIEVKEAHEKNERAISMAQQTKSGFVYVISNIGSFGNNVYKIGMTRRLEPLDRVRELGDASVPFIFDVHAMIYSENAPMLENQLHKVFDEKRLNLVNRKKEFFNISLSEIKEEVYKINKDAEFIETIQAQEYRESLALREARKIKESNEEIINKYPDSL